MKGLDYPRGWEGGEGVRLSPHGRPQRGELLGITYPLDGHV